MAEPKNRQLPSGHRGAGQSRLTTILLVGVLAIVGVWVLAVRSTPVPLVGWGESLEAGMNDGRNRNAPVLVLATADWCGPCQSLRRDVLGKESVAARLSREFVLVKLDLTKSPSPAGPDAERLDVRGIPALIALNPNTGEELGRHVGNLSETRFNTWLDGVAAKAK